MKKKFLGALLMLCVLSALLAALPVTANAAASGIYRYEVSNGEATITDCDTSASGAITIPSELGGCPVTSIGDYAFSSCDRLTGITIPDGVTSIGYGTFWDCTGLTSVTIPGSVTSIGERAFSGCTGLTSITIPDGVTSIGGWAFSSCESFTRITIPDSVTSIGEYAFVDCYGLTSITIPGSVTSIGGYAFYSCYGLTSVTILEGVMSIGEWAFAHCNGLTSITIPDGVTSIGASAFAYCKSLTSITIPGSVTSIGERAFYICMGLTDVYYGGSKEQWGNISIGSDNSHLTQAATHYAANLHYNVNGDIWKTEKAVTDSEFTLTTDLPVRDNYTFLGWAATADAVEAQYQPGDTITVGTEDITLYAVWEQTAYTATTEVNGIFVVTPTGVPVGSSIMLVCYKDGAVVHVGKFEYDGSAAVPFFVNAAEYDTVKVFVWDSVVSMVPVTEPEEVL